MYGVQPAATWSTRCESLATRSDYQELEFVVVFDDATPEPVLHALRRIAGDRLRLVPFHDDFNFSAKINAGATAATGDLFLVLNDDTELIDPASVGVMVAHLELDDVGDGRGAAAVLRRDAAARRATCTTTI